MRALRGRSPELCFLPGLRQRALYAAAVLLAAGLTVGSATAHPIVSTDINRHVIITIGPRQVEVDYLYEMLEIAAIGAAREADTDRDGTTSEAEAKVQFDRWVEALAGHLDLDLEGVPLALVPTARTRSKSAGPFGLFTTRWNVRFTASLPARGVRGSLVFRDRYRQDQVGWKEIVVRGVESVTVWGAGASATDRSKRLTDYAAIADLPNPNETGLTVMLGRAVAQAPSATLTSIDPAEPSAPDTPSRSELAASKLPVPRTPSVAAEVKANAPSPSPAAPAARTWSGRMQQDGWPFFRLGAHHIATGYDHLLFLLGLLLFRQSLARVAAVITAFTVAHSLTLALAALGWITPPVALIDLLIPATIAYVGAAALLNPSSRHGPLLAFGFGLIHGFGFAGALNAVLGDRMGSAWLVSLFSFNLGIEAFQLLAVCLAYPLLRFMERHRWSIMARRLLSFSVMSAGLGWLVARAASL
jgi:hypothetical protein